MLDVLRFWLDRGVDGFRVDAIHHLIKDAEFRDNPPNPDCAPGSRRTTRCCRSTAWTSRGARRRSPRCARVLDASTAA